MTEAYCNNCCMEVEIIDGCCSECGTDFEFKVRKRNFDEFDEEDEWTEDDWGQDEWEEERK